MKLFFYYAFCSVKNQIKKLCKTWFIIFLIGCMVFGGLVGIGIGILSESLDEGEVEEPLPDEELPDEDEELTPEEKEELLLIVDGGILLFVIVMFFFAVLFADKSGSSIFLMPDVNFLFSAPMKPQSVLLFRLMNQILVVLAASLYFVFQIPTLVMSFGISVFAAVMVLAAWIFIVAYQKLINILVYTLASTYDRVKKYLRPASFTAVGVLAFAYFLIYLKTNDPLVAFTSMFSSKAARYIPILGWIKGLVMWSIEGDIFMTVLMAVLLSLFAAGLTYLVWRIKADFYEEAMHQSQKTAEALTAAQGGAAAKRDKDRSDKMIRDGLNRGSGANVFFFKSIYNRKRFSHFGVLTKTAEFYLFASVAAALLLRFVIKTNSFTAIGIGLCIAVFFRALGNPLAMDMDKACFVTIPASAHEKVLWSVLAGSLDCALNVLPAALISAVIVGASPLETAAFYLLALAVDFYASNVMLFIEFSLPSSIDLQVKQMVSVFFIYFGLVPIGAVVGIGMLLSLVDIFLFIASFAAFAIGGIFFIFSPIFIEKGRK